MYNDLLLIITYMLIQNMSVINQNQSSYWRGRCVGQALRSKLKKIRPRVLKKKRQLNIRFNQLRTNSLRRHRSGCWEAVPATVLWWVLVGLERRASVHLHTCDDRVVVELLWHKVIKFIASVRLKQIRKSTHHLFSVSEWLFLCLGAQCHQSLSSN